MRDSEGIDLQENCLQTLYLKVRRLIRVFHRIARSIARFEDRAPEHLSPLFLGGNVIPTNCSARLISSPNNAMKGATICGVIEFGRWISSSRIVNG